MDRRTALAVLGLGDAEARDPATVKRAYRRALLSAHPDKATDPSTMRPSVDLVRQSFAVLSSNFSQDGKVTLREENERVDLDEFDYRDGRYWRPCRCGHGFAVSEADLARGDDLVACEGCSLLVRVLYEEADNVDDEEEEGKEEDQL